MAPAARLAALPSIHVLDRLPSDRFVAAVAPLFEGAPAFLGRLAAGRPFGSWAALFAEARRIARRMPEPDQVELVDAHPRLGAPPASVSARSHREQGYDRDGAAADGRRVAADLDRLNGVYESRFGFRFCIFVAGRPRSAMIPLIEAALGADRRQELDRAIAAVIDIAEDRLRTATAEETRS